MACYVVQSNQLESTEGIPALRQYCIATSVGFTFGDPAMKRIPLTQGQFALVDDDDFDWLMQWKWYARWHPKTNSYYAVRNSPRVNGKTHPIWMHREILGLKYGDKLQGDHIHHQTLDNRRGEIRIATHRENCQNVKRKVSSKYPGVYWDGSKNRWASDIKFNRVRYHLGRFVNELDAAAAYTNTLSNYNTKGILP